MDWRFYTPEDHALVAGWWEKRGWRVIPQAGLPPTGAIAYDGEKPIACAWLYKSDSCVAMIGFFISNPESTARQAHEGIKLIVGALSETAEAQGYTTIFCTVIKEGLAKAIESQGFTYREQNSINLFRVIENGC